MGYNLSKITLGTHQSTHLDAPYHYLIEWDTLSEMDVSRCICRAIKVDLTYKSPGEPITVSDLLPYEKQIDAGLSVLMHIGWDKVFPHQDFFSEFPYLSLKLAKWFAQKKINLVGMDMPTPNGSECKEVHEIMLGAKIIMVEGLSYLENLPEGEFTFIALPLKIKRGDGSPVRAVAILD